MTIGGRELRVTPSSFDEALTLQETISEALQKTSLSLDIGEEIEQTEITGGNFDAIVKAALSVGTSRKVRDALFACAKRAVWGEERVTRELFEDVENRQHYYAVMIEIAKVNLGPFVGGLSSAFSGVAALAKGQKQK